jgi:hypothetical protein
MEVDVGRPAATFEYERASKDMILAPPDELAKGMRVIVRSKRQQLCGGRRQTKTRAADVSHRISVGRRVMIVHSDFDLDAGLHDREFAGKRGDQFRSGLERIHHFFAPRACLPASSRWTT